MKILSLRLRNINSLKGNWEIRFDRPPLTGAGIFAITGPTGAGKTSILDALTLALYGETVRLGKTPAEEIMTRHTGDCFAEAVFRTGGGVYRSHWACHRSRRKPDGKISMIRMALSTETGADIVAEEGLTAVRAAVTELTGLDFDRFTRSCLLAQGGFAAFLNAGDNRRAELLEKITGTEIYSEISKRAFERAREAEDRLETARLRLSALGGVDETEYERLQTETGADQAEIDRLRSRHNELLLEREERKEIDRLTGESERLSRLVETAVAGRTALAEEETRLSAARAAERHAGDIHLLETNTDEAKRREASLATLTAEHEAAAADTAAATESVESARDRLREVRAERTSIEETIRKTLLLDRDLEIEERRKKTLLQEKATAADRVAEYRKQLQSLIQKQTAMRREMETIQKRLSTAPAGESPATDLPLIRERSTRFLRETQVLDELSRQAAAAEKTLSQNRAKAEETENTYRAANIEVEKLQNALTETEKKAANALSHRSPDEWEDLRKACETEIARLQALVRIDEETADLSVRQHQIQARLNRMKIEHTETVSRGKQLSDELEAAEEVGKSLSAEAEQALLTAKYEADRNRLTPGTPCPLCGSIEHPYAEGIVPDAAGADRKLAEQHRREAELRRRLREADTQAARSEAALSGETERLSEVQNRVTDLARSRSKQADPADPTPLSEVLARKTKEAETIRNRLAEHRRIIARREAHLTEWRAAQNRLNNLKDQGHRAEADVTRGITERNRLAAGIADQTRSLEDTRQTLADTLARYGESVPGEAETVKESIRRLEERASSHQAQKERMTALSAEEAKLRETMAGVETALEEWKKREGALLSELSTITEQVETLLEKRKILFGDRDPATEEQRINDAVAKAEALVTGAMESRSAGERRRESAAALLTAEKSAAKTLADQVARRRAKLTAAAKESGFRDVTELMDSRLDETNRVEIEARLQAATDRLHSAETLQAEVTRRLEEKSRALPAPRPLLEIETEIEAGELKIATLQQRVGAAEETLRRQREIRENHRVAEQEVSERENDYRRWNHLRRLIGSHKGDEFRKFAQGLTLEQLLFHANGHLKRLSGRYRLCRRTGGHMGLDILDTHQADARRPTQTLSGGESFQVSLALALALSDLAGRRRKVESLFLDEGFGQLDERALDTALGTLETLRSRGRTIGVISHVSALKERIPVQIQVERQTGGAGRIVIRGYSSPEGEGDDAGSVCATM